MIADRWPGEPAVSLSAWREGAWRTVAESGDLDLARPWASVTKLVIALAAAVDVEAGRARLDEALGPQGSTLAHLLAHASGLGLEEGDPVGAPGARRVYSNIGIDLAAARLAPGGDVAAWLHERVVGPLALASLELRGRASEGMWGSTRDLARFATQWVTPSVISPRARDATASSFLPDLAGVVPGFGRFDPCPWGMGVQVRGTSRHWMGDWPSDSFGHFGRSGALALVNVPEALVLVATSSVVFGPWAKELWPPWTSQLRELALAS